MAVPPGPRQKLTEGALLFNQKLSILQAEEGGRSAVWGTVSAEARECSQEGGDRNRGKKGGLYEPVLGLHSQLCQIPRKCGWRRK